MTSAERAERRRRRGLVESSGGISFYCGDCRQPYRLKRGERRSTWCPTCREKRYAASAAARAALGGPA